MPYRLSLLDQVLIAPDVAPTRAIADSVRLAVRAEELGYHRYWFAEHHGIGAVASTAPETLAAFVLARTQRIRVGSGGVMLQHYAPFKVAESFNVLAALAPGRVDLGVGRAPGGLPKATRALRSSPPSAEEFTEKLAELEAFVSDTLPENHPFSGAVAGPRPTEPPERILLGASKESAETAAKLGWTFCYAGHFDGDPERMRQAFETYRGIAGRSPLLAQVAFAAASEDEARAQVDKLKLYRVKLSTGQQVNVGDLDTAAEFARQSGLTDYSVEEIAPQVLSGTAAQVRAELDRLHDELGVEEFVIAAPVPAFADRLASIELLAPDSASRTVASGTPLLATAAA